MATRLYSVDPGLSLEDVVEAAGSAITTKHVELTVDLANTIVNNQDGTTRTISKEEVLFAIEQIEQKIIRGNWPPA